MVVTFLIGSLSYTLDTLDSKRLGKQRVEAMQIINVIEQNLKGWSGHPAVKMWKNHVTALKYYHNKVVKKWIARGFNNNMELYDIPKKKYIEFPWWYKFKPLHMSHKASLYRKNPEYYSEHFEMTDELQKYLKTGYFWPHKYEPMRVEDFTLEMCDPIGTGAPAEYRWSREDVLKWINKKEINPKTGRKIKEGANIYLDLTKAAKHYDLL